MKGWPAHWPAVVKEALEKSHKALTLFLVEVEPALVTILEIVLVPLTGSPDPLIGCDGAIKHLGDVFLGGRHSMSWIALKISRATAGAMALPYAFTLAALHFGKVMPSNFLGSPSSPPQKGRHLGSLPIL